jgi:hypothetical protein
MKKTQQILVTIISLIILTFFVGTSWADVCAGDYIVDDNETSGDIAVLSGCTEVTGNLTIQNTALTNLDDLDNLTSVSGNLWLLRNSALTSLSALSNLTSVGGTLSVLYSGALTSLTGLENITTLSGWIEIRSNSALTSLSGLENLTSVGGTLYIQDNDALNSLDSLENLTSVGYDLRIENNDTLVNLCALYNVNVPRDLYIDNNILLSMDTAYALETQLISNGFTGTSDILNNNGTVNIFCEIDIDGDGFLDTEDNCPSVCNSQQLDADGDGAGDVCDSTPGCGGCGQSECEESC